MALPWARPTVDAVLRATTIRHAARLEGVHHSTMQTRIETLTHKFGFDPMTGYGRTRLGMAYLLWRLRTSGVMDLPTPAGQLRDVQAGGWPGAGTPLPEVTGRPRRARQSC